MPPICLINDTLLSAIHEFSEGGGEESSLETELYKTILPSKRPYHTKILFIANEVWQNGQRQHLFKMPSAKEVFSAGSNIYLKVYI